MSTPNTLNRVIESPARATLASARPAAAGTPLAGIERMMAEALTALDREPPGAPSEPGAIEYASWVHLLRRTAP